MSNQAELTDESPMPFEKHKGTAMANVPASYLIYLYDNDYCYGAVKNYISDNIDVLKLEVFNAANKLK